MRMYNSLLFELGLPDNFFVGTLITLPILLLYILSKVFKGPINRALDRELDKQEAEEKAHEQQLIQFMQTAPKIPAYVTHVKDLGTYEETEDGPYYATAYLYVTLENGAQHKIKTAMHLTRVVRTGDTVQLIFDPKKNTYIYADCPISWFDRKGPFAIRTTGYA